MREALGLSGRLSPAGLWGLLGVLLGLIAINLPELGSDPWPFEPGAVDPTGVLAPLVRAAGEEWDVGIARAACFLAGLALALIAAWALRRSSGRSGEATEGQLRGTASAGWPAWVGTALVVGVALALLLPSTLLQVGLRDATEPWFFTNDSTFQIDLAGDLVLQGDNPYGHDYRFSGMERFYSFDGEASERIREREVPLVHYAYFPGTALSAAAWQAVVPAPFDDYRLFVLLATLAGFFAVLAFRGPLAWRLVLGAVVVANPIAVRSAWFGQNDAPALTLTILAFALATRGRFRWAAVALAAAVLFKQFAVVAVPFLALMAVKQGVERRELLRCAALVAGVIAAACLPFVIADPAAFWEDTVEFGAGTYKIVGYGLSAMLVRAGILADRDGAYPFALIAVLTWLPLTAYLLVQVQRARDLWPAAAGFAISILVLLFIGRTFNNYYLVWPLTGAIVAAALAAWERRPASPSPSLSPPSP
ncbi:MAG TPA: glycosyltransferase 87 family protein [Thermoleophilaceae bacterium]|nr:glycosyltransferase 87 family protein [Thermoleophilaceae bacterium]